MIQTILVIPTTTEYDFRNVLTNNKNLDIAQPDSNDKWGGEQLFFYENIK